MDTKLLRIFIAMFICLILIVLIGVYITEDKDDNENNIFKIISNTLYDDSINESTIEIGQTWYYISNEKDPFKETDTLYYHVIDIKDNYVQYSYLNRFDKRKSMVDSSPIDIFISYRKLLTKEK